MKAILSLFPVMLLLGKPTVAQQADSLQPKLYGEFFSDQRFLLKSPNRWIWNENRLSLKLKKRIKGEASFHSELWMRNMGFSKIAVSSDLQDKGTVDPYNIELREAYFDMYDFLFKGLDLRIGRQRVAWGTADQLNPTDNINPYDYEDVLDFGRHRGADAVNLTYYLNSEFSLQAIWLPLFKPANLPAGEFADLFAPPITLPAPLVLKELHTQVVTPDNTLQHNSSYGIRLKGFLAGVDFSISYLRAWDGVPFITNSTLNPVDQNGGVSISVQSAFIQNHIIGFDFAGSVGGMGIWAEAAVFVPEREVVMTTDLSALYPALPPSLTIVDSVTFRKQPFMKYIAGADYHFSNGAYLNIQFLHGFITERGKQHLNDYLFVKLEKTYLDERLKLVPLAGGLLITDWSDMVSGCAFAYIPELSFMATDNAELALSAAVFHGTDNSLFSRLDGFDMFKFRFSYSF